MHVKGLEQCLVCGKHLGNISSLMLSLSSLPSPTSHQTPFLSTCLSCWLPSSIFHSSPNSFLLIFPSFSEVSLFLDVTSLILSAIRIPRDSFSSQNSLAFESPATIYYSLYIGVITGGSELCRWALFPCYLLRHSPVASLGWVQHLNVCLLMTGRWESH